MPSPPIASISEFQPWALAVANVGTWHCSLAEEWTRCDAVMADMLGLTEAETRDGVPFARIRGIVHPEDRFIFDRKNEQVREAGGIVVMEYRIRPEPGVERWVLVRGRYERSPGGAGVTGHGIAVDVTATKANTDDAADRFYATSGALNPGPSSIQRAADAAIALHREAEGLDADVPGLKLVADLALDLIGRYLARLSISRDLN